MMTPKEAYLAAGKIHYEVLQRAKGLLKPGVLYVAIARQIEEWILEKGASLAFPVNIQVNNLVHYAPIIDDPSVLKGDDLVKLDIGVHVEGYIADGALSVSFDPRYQDMVNFTRDTLRKALVGLRPGMPISEIGRRLDACMKESPYKIVRNLMGHQLNQWDLHSKKSVLVYENAQSPHLLEPGEAFAVEIFITDGDGWIRAAPEVTIYAVKNPKAPCRNPRVKALILDIWKRRRSFPFSERYVLEHLGCSRLDFFQLRKTDALQEYQVLVEKQGSKVAQFEDVIYVDDDAVLVTTQPQNI